VASGLVFDLVTLGAFVELHTDHVSFEKAADVFGISICRLMERAICCLPLQIKLAPLAARLRIYCAGVWHNTALAGLTVALLYSLPGKNLSLNVAYEPPLTTENKYRHGLSVGYVKRGGYCYRSCPILSALRLFASRRCSHQLWYDSCVVEAVSYLTPLLATHIPSEMGEFQDGQCPVYDLQSLFVCHHRVMSNLMDAKATGICLPRSFVSRRNTSEGVWLDIDGLHCCAESSDGFSRLCFHHSAVDLEKITPQETACMSVRPAVVVAAGARCAKELDCRAIINLTTAIITSNYSTNPMPFAVAPHMPAHRFKRSSL
jgi:hypothetical protein